MSAIPKIPTPVRYNRVRKCLENDVFFKGRFKGNTLPVVHPSGEQESFPEEIIGITNYIHETGLGDVMQLGKDEIRSVAADLVKDGTWKKHLPTGGKVVAQGRKVSTNGTPAKAKAPAAPKAPRAAKAPKAAKPKRTRASKPADEKKSDAPHTEPQGAGQSRESGNHQPSQESKGSSRSQTDEVSAAHDRLDVNRSRLRPVKKVPPQFEYTIPVISLLMGAEQIMEVYDLRTGNDGRMASLRALIQEFQQIAESKPSRGEATAK